MSLMRNLCLLSTTMLTAAVLASPVLAQAKVTVLTIGYPDEDTTDAISGVTAPGIGKLEAAFEALAPERLAKRDDPVRVTVMGAGLVGKHAVEAALKYGSLERAAAWAATHPPVEVVTIGRSLTGDERYLRDRFARTDILVDATQRSDSSRPLIPNAWIAWLPPHAGVRATGELSIAGRGGQRLCA